MVIALRISTNASQVARNMSRRRERIELAARQANAELAEFIEDRAEFYAPTKSGQLRQSIRRFRIGKNQFTIRTSDPKAKFIEKGTAPSSSFGFLPGRGGKYGEGYNVPLFSRFGFPQKPHPGVKSYKFMERAANDGRREAKKIFTNRIRASIKREVA